jgi:integral membrane protein
MLKTFRIVALLEGVSYLLLAGAAIYKRMPNGNDELVKLLGMPHGLLFVAYVALAVFLRITYKWDAKTFIIILLGSLIPFGTFYVDKKYLKPLA